MRVIESDITLLEVPGHVSLYFAVHGCPGTCPGCSWADRDTDTAQELTIETYQKTLDQYKGLVTCIVFLGGEWCDELTEFLARAKVSGYTTCLYTGRDQVDPSISRYLDFLKTGPYVEALGGLDSATTNQRFTEVATGECLNHLFVKR